MADSAPRPRRPRRLHGPHGPRSPRLAAAAGPLEGTVPGAQPPLRLALVGESTAAGVGAPTHEASLAGHLARALRETTGREVSWRARGQGGATAGRVTELLVPRLTEGGWTPTHVVVLIGINDVQRSWRRGAWERDVLALLAGVVHRCPGARVVVSGMPDLTAVPALPRVLRPLLAAKARRMAATTGQAARAVGAVYVPVHGLPLPPEFFAADGLHPGPAGYARWAEGLAPVVAAL